MWNSFAFLASSYDRFNDESIYSQWLDYSLMHLDGPVDRALDLACGTGDFTLALAPFCQEVIGLDLSSDMVRQAQTKDLPDNLAFQVGDMTTLDFPKDSFSLVTCYLDSLCFLPDYPSLVQAFQEAHRVLRPQGFYLFDVWTPDHLRTYFRDFYYEDQLEGQILTWRSQVDPRLPQVTHRIQIQPEGLEGQLQETSYPLEAYLDGLVKAGFSRQAIQVSSDFGRDLSQAGLLASERWFFAVQKEG